MCTRALEKNFAVLEASLVPNEEYRVEFQERIWKWMPEEILWIILLQLPVAAQCRFRSVSKRWAAFLSAPPATQTIRPTCTIMGNGEHSEDWFFCHEEKKWFRIPLQPRFPDFEEEELGWVLVATAGGLICYESTAKDPEDPSSNFLIYNPMTGSSRRLRAKRSRPTRFPLRLATFSVDLESKTFVVVLMNDRKTVIYDWKSNKRRTFPSGSSAFPDLRGPIYETDDSDRGFVWKDVICRRAGQSRTYLAFDMVKGVWTAMRDVDLPCDMEEIYYLRSWKDQVVLVQLRPKTDEPVRVWMLRDTGMDALNLSAPNWEKVPVEIPESMKAVAYELENCFSHGHEYVCFTTGWTHHWVKYTFKSKTWRFMPRRDRFDDSASATRDPELDYVYEEFQWFNFEPQIHTDVLRSSQDNAPV